MKKYTISQSVIFRFLLFLWFSSLALHAPADDELLLSVLSWNVWFDDQTGKTRYPLILDEIYRQDADIVLLQEVTPLFLNYIQTHPLRTKYNTLLSKRSAGYQNITLSKSNPELVRILPLESAMSRTAQITHIQFSGCSLQIANLHLESPLDDTKLRIKQLHQILSSLTRNSPVIVAGDFNFGNNSQEERFLENRLQDLANTAEWKNDVTYDIENNAWAEDTKYWFEPSRRLDRIYFQNLETSGWAYQLIGTQPNKQGEYLSDHYGVKVSIRLTDRPACH